MTKLIDQINELRATAQERAEQRRLEELAAQAMIVEEDSRHGREWAESTLDSIRGNILSLASDNQSSTTITVQSNSNQYEMTAYESAYSTTIANGLTDEGLTVKLVRNEHKPQGASSFTPSYSTYSAYLFVSW